MDEVFEPRGANAGTGPYAPVEQECDGGHMTIIDGLGFVPQCRKCGSAVSAKTGKVLKAQVAPEDRLQQNLSTRA